MDELRRSLAPGSHIAISTAATEGMPRDELRKLEAAYEKSTVRLAIRTHTQIEDLFTGMELIGPGVVPVGQWRADEPPTHGKILGGVARITA